MAERTIVSVSPENVISIGVQGVLFLFGVAVVAQIVKRWIMPNLSRASGGDVASQDDSNA